MSSTTISRQESLEKLKTNEFDVLIVGAGITGACIAWDAALRGLKVAIIDKEDFGAGTSSGSSKLVHAGIRYLANREFSLVRHASRERQWMFKMIPHLTAPIPFIIPNYKNGKNSLLKLSFAGTFYDLLSSFKNTENHAFYNKDETLTLVPNLKKDTLMRSLYYWDGVMDDARVTLETILSAQENKAVTLNHVKALKFILEDEPELGEVTRGVHAEDTLTEEKFDIKAKIVVNVTGPWTDKVLEQLPDHKKMLRTTKGIHIITKRLVKENVVVVITADDERGMFVIPFRRKYSLIGTTDTDYKEDMDHIGVTEEDIDYAVSAVNNDLPDTLTKSDVISAYSGVRPLLISPKAKSETDTSAGFKVIETRPNLLTVTGGKYTIFRYMAEKTVDKILKVLKLSKKEHKCLTKKTPIHGGEGIDNYQYLRMHVPAIMKKYQLPVDIADHIVHTYGTAYPEIISLINEDPKYKERLGDNRPHIAAEIKHAIDNEMCCTLSDFMLRRTQLQLIDHQGLDIIDKIARLMGEHLGWNAKEQKQQIADYKKDLMWLPAE